MTRRWWPQAVSLLALCALAGCGVSDTAPMANSDCASAPAVVEQVDAEPAAAEDIATPTPPAAFAAAPHEGRIVRANCRMGGCWWYWLESVQVEDAAPPRYLLQLRVGDSGPHPDPYPLQPQGVSIRWDAQPQPDAIVSCSHDAPQVQFGDAVHVLTLSPEGVSGVEQGVANLYFATCHGEYGDDDA